jgi:phosphatidate cytidylyltransferase
MALNTQILLTRSLSAVVFVVVLLGSVLWRYESFAVFFFVISIVALKEYLAIAEKLGAKPYKAMVYFLAICVYLVFIDGFLIQFDGFFLTLNRFKAMIAIIPLLIFIRAVFDNSSNAINNSAYTIIALLYTVLPFIMLNQIVGFRNTSNGHDFNPHLVLGVIFLIWANDTFAYLGGSLFGKHKMIPRVSPGKTWEGTIIGILIAFAISFTFKCFLNVQSDWIWPVLGICIPLLATLGDLVESLLKRNAGVKDSGQLMPGHGGALDRFDSLIMAAPFVYALAQFL